MVGVALLISPVGNLSLITGSCMSRIVVTAVEGEPTLPRMSVAVKTMLFLPSVSGKFTVKSPVVASAVAVPL